MTEKTIEKSTINIVPGTLLLIITCLDLGRVDSQACRARTEGAGYSGPTTLMGNKKTETSEAESRPRNQYCARYVIIGLNLMRR